MVRKFMFAWGGGGRIARLSSPPPPTALGGRKYKQSPKDSLNHLARKIRLAPC